MNAGQSAEGQQFAVNNADMIFINLGDTEGVPTNIASIRAAAKDKGKEASIWGAAHIICRDTEAEARELIRHYIDDLGDFEAARNYAAGIFGTDAAATETYRADPGILRRLVETSGHYPIVGTPEQVVTELKRLSDAGIDGILFSWLDYDAGIAQYVSELYPLMKQAGLRAEDPALSGASPATVPH
jgi:alkanesulfonate monooxygenase SsuD/methylene tetrahydromethanopterin reductase-like flavin-dependent oxidoreductase (luciferase family)